MRERIVHFEEEQALDKMVANEFERMERIALKKPVPVKKSRPQESGNIAPLNPSSLDEDAGGLFDDEENQFVKQAVDWLSPRKNKDAVIARIYSLLVESQPEAFYETPPEDPGLDPEPADGSGSATLSGLDAEQRRGQERPA